MREFPTLSLNGKLLLLYFLSSPVSTMIGLYYDSLRDIAHYTSLTRDDLLAAIEELSSTGSSRTAATPSMCLFAIS